MAEIPAIITAVAGVIVAVGGVILAVSKLGPFLNALNKLMTDQQKRAMAAKSKATIQQPSAITVSTVFDLSLPRQLKISTIIILSGNGLAVITQLLTTGPATPYTVVICTIAAVGTICITVAYFGVTILKSIAAMTLLAINTSEVAPPSTQS